VRLAIFSFQETTIVMHPRFFRCCAGLLAWSTLLLAPRAAEAQPPKSAPAAIRRQLLDQRPVAGAPGLETQLWLIDYPPGASAPVHRHPVVGIGYVIEGAFDSTFAGQAPVHVSAGQSFVDPARSEHSVFRNSSATQPLKMLVAYTIPSGTPIMELTAAPRVQLKSGANPLRIASPALYPETLAVNAQSNQFLVGSFSEGAVYEVGLDGKAKKLVADPRLTSILGIAVDPRAGRLLVTNSDLGAGLRRSRRGPKKEAGVGVYELASGRALEYVDLGGLLPEAEHLINGITLDSQGNAYVTDSLSPVIYKVEPGGKASVFLQSEEFKGAGINLNGIVFHPKGFLLVVKKSSGALYRIPLADPQRFARVQLPTTFVGGDGLQLVGDEQLVLVANQTPAAALRAAFVLASSDDWASAKLIETRDLGDVYPTSCTVRDGKLYVLSSHLDEWLAAPEGARAALLKQGRQADILQIGALTP
jgi:quercetin dioxygenase-like cupin family protein